MIKLQTVNAYLFILFILMSMETTRTFAFYLELMTWYAAMLYTAGFQFTYIFLLFNNFKKTVIGYTVILFFISAASYYTPLTKTLQEERERIGTPLTKHAEEQNKNCPIIKSQKLTEDGKILSYEYPEPSCIQNNKRIAIDNNKIDKDNAPIIEANKKLNIEIPIKFWFNLISAIIFSLVPMLMGVISNALSSKLIKLQTMNLNEVELDKLKNSGLKINKMDISSVSHRIQNS